MLATHLASLVTLSLTLAAGIEPPANPRVPVAAFAQGGAVQAGDAVQLVLQGNTAFTERRFADALEAFTKASKLLPAEANVHFMVGYSAYMLGQFSASQPSLERALSINPRLTGASTILGLVLYRLGKVADAVNALEAGQKYAPDDKDIADLLAKWRPEANLQKDLYEARGAHFSVLFQGPADDLAARRIVELLEEAYWRIGGVLSTYPAEPVAVLLYTKEQFRTAANVPDWAAGAYDGRIKIPTIGALQNPEALKSLLAHEYTHAVVAQIAGGSVPKWLNEGLSELLESDDARHIDSVLAKSSRRLTQAQLERDFATLPADDVPLAYAQSAFAVRKMIELRGAPAVVSLLQALGRGTRFDQAFQSTIFMRYEEFVSMLSRY
jgi:hypothetical protein